MATRIIRPYAPPHVVVPDTNILWAQDKTHPVNPVFDSFWDAYQPLLPIELALPEVVFGELWFQQTTSACKALDKINDQLKDINGIANAAYSHKIEPAKLRKQVHDKLERWLNAKNGILVTVPISSVDWLRVVNQAIWREPPFVYDPKTPDNEKGFRDAMILETLVHLVTTSQKKNVVFLSNDYVLRTAAETRLTNCSTCLFFEELPAFVSYIHLTQEQLTNEFVRAIQHRARGKFFDPNEQSCFYYSEQIRNRIEEQFKEAIEKPQLSLKQDLASAFLAATAPIWSPATSQWWINHPRFLKLEGAKQFQWASRVTLARLYTELKEPRGATLAGLLAMPQQRLLLLGFDVNWKATVKTDGRFHDLQLVDIELKERSFEVPTPDELKRWKLTQVET